MELLLSYYFEIMKAVYKIKLAKDIYNTCMVLNNYCQNNMEDEKISDISTLIEFLTKNADTLYFELKK